MVTDPPASRLARLRRTLGATVADGFFNSLARVGKLHPLANPAKHGVEVLRDVPYLPSGLAEHRLDIYRPAGQRQAGPALLYVHGGGFRILSKDTHWVFGLAFARRGFTVFNVSYRLGPQHPFPAALDDVCQAYRFVADNAARYGAHLNEFVLAGESAGANLVAALAVAACFERPEAFAKVAFNSPATPRVVLPACGMFQVSDPGRFRRRRPEKIGAFVEDRLREVHDAYLADAALGAPGSRALADPLCVLEGPDPAQRPLPAFFVGVGTGDPLLDDTRRLHAALQRRGVACEARYYPRQPHAFHALVMLPEARNYWADQFAFLERTLGRPLPVVSR